MSRLRFKIKKSLSLVFSILLSCMFLANPVLSFASDSFSQLPMDEYSWEIMKAKVEYFDGYPYPIELGDRLKIIITAANNTNNYDCLYGLFYENSVSNRTWVQNNPNEQLLVKYNGTKGFILYQGIFVFFIPHNETSVNTTLYILALSSNVFPAIRSSICEDTCGSKIAEFIKRCFQMW